MKNRRRDFIKWTGLAGLGVAGGVFSGFSSGTELPGKPAEDMSRNNPVDYGVDNAEESNISIIGAYGAWAASLADEKLPSLSFRSDAFTDVETWRTQARKCLTDRLAMPSIGELPKVTVTKQTTFEGLHIEELSWQLPYGRATEALLLKPANAKGPLPAILAFHDHGGNKYFGKRKITRTPDAIHPLMEAHQKEYYEGRAWANEIAKQGFVVLVADAFPFASRRVMIGDVPAHMQQGLNDQDPENTKNIQAYNEWAGQHEHTMAKSLFSAGTTWPGVFLAEDRKALDILCARPDVDADRIGCGGLSGGGMRTVFMAGSDPRIKCAVCVGFMTTWKDFLLNKSYTHTWMTYVPLLPNELDFPEILGLRAPLPTLVLNDEADELYTMPEMKRADDMLAEIFKKAGAADHYKCSYYPGPHKFDAKMQTEAFEWFGKWLKG